ncbi:MAG: glycosyltransferase [Bacteroidota bacterium]|nr:glycosyltransferase [Bacteroidota bacterium]
MKLSVIIVNYNVKYFLEQCLLSVRHASKGLAVEVFVVDNNSVDGSVQMVAEKFPEFHIIANKENVGFSKGNNQAIKIAKGDYILLLNPDTVVQDDTFAKTIEFMDSHADAGGLGVMMVDGGGKYLPESKRGLPSPSVALYKMFGLSKLFPKSKVFGAYHLGYLDQNETHEIDVLSGAFMMLRKSLLDKIGALDETFFMYGEDVDLSYRITQAGYKNYYYPGSTIIHYKGESTKKSSVNYVLVFYKAMAIFAQKHFQRNKAGLFGLLINMAIYLRAGLAIVQRFIYMLWRPVLEGLLCFASLYILIQFWETQRYPNGGYYPAEFFKVNAPIYSILWVLGIYLNGGYRSNAGLLSLGRGIITGTLAVAVFYAFAPLEIRFSRALILLGGVGAFTICIIERLVINGLIYKSLIPRWGKEKNALIVGDLDEAIRVKNLLEKLAAPVKTLGIVTPEKAAKDDDRIIGYMAQLPQLIEVFSISEVIFCSKDIKAKDIITFMGNSNARHVDYKIVPEESLFVIGSNSKNSRGDFYTIEIHLELSQQGNKRLKRAFDILIAIIAIIVSPLAIILQGFKFHILQYAWQVFINKRTWVGYAGVGKADGLPSLKPGVFSPADVVGALPENGKTFEKINLLYAKNYSVDKDLGIIVQMIFKKKKS